MDTVPNSDVCTCKHHKNPETSFCMGNCCKECPHCRQNIVADRYDAHALRCAPAGTGRFTNPFDDVPASRIESALARAADEADKKNSR